MLNSIEAQILLDILNPEVETPDGDETFEEQVIDIIRILEHIVKLG
jgi:hypothetical protein